MANKVTIIPNTSKVKVSQEETTVVTVQTPGPKGDTGISAYTSTTDLEARHITASSISASVNIDFKAPNDITDDTLFRIPIVNGFTDGAYPFQSYTSGFTLKIKQPNRINSSYKTDELQIGNGSTAAGGIRLESTAGNPTYISTDGDFTLDAQTREIILSGSTDVKGTIESDGLILTSPNGTRFKLTVENGGGLAATEL